MEAVRYASNYKPIIDRNTPMTKDEVAHMVKMLRGLYPASPYTLDEDLVITTWRASQRPVAIRNSRFASNVQTGDAQA
jgi:hypothetical protein